MIKIVRINFPPVEGGRPDHVFQKALAECGLTMADIEVKTQDGHYSNKTHFGNWCVTPALDNEATRKVAEHLGGAVDLHQEILEEDDLGNFRFDDKVIVSFTSGFGADVEERGKVLRCFPTRKTETKTFRGEIAITKGRSKSKGWIFVAGDHVTIRKIAGAKTKKKEASL